MTEEKYDLKVVPEEAAMKISTATDPKVVVTITLTSPVMREGEEAEHGTCYNDLLHYHRALVKSLFRCNKINLNQFGNCDSDLHI